MQDIEESWRSSAYDPQSDPRLVHKGRGRKLTFLWSEKGEQVIVDSYVLKALRGAEAVANHLRETLDPVDLALVKPQLDAVARHAATPPELLDPAMAGKAIGLLWLTQQSLGESFPESVSAKLSALIEEYGKTVGVGSHKSEHSGRTVNTSPAGAPNENEEMELYRLAQEPLKQMPKTDKERLFKQALQRDILFPIGAIVRDKVGEGANIGRERSVVRLLARLGTVVGENEGRASAAEVVEQLCDKLRIRLIEGGYDPEIVSAVDKLRREAVSYVSAPST